METAFTALKRHCTNEQRIRMSNYEKFAKMAVLRKRQVLKAWFNSINVLKRVSKLKSVMRLEKTASMRYGLHLWLKRARLHDF